MSSLQHKGSKGGFIHLLSVGLVLFGLYAGAEARDEAKLSAEPNEETSPAALRGRLLQSCSTVRCGWDWSDANGKCGVDCASQPGSGWGGPAGVCPGGEKCFSDVQCCAGGPAPTPSSGGCGNCCANLRCGLDWSDANGKCGVDCSSQPGAGWGGPAGVCPGSEKCFSDMGCCDGAGCCTGGGDNAPAPSPGTGGTGAVLYSGSGSGTYYYDVTGRTCNGAQSYAENQGYPSCTSYDPAFYKTIQDYGTNNIVAIDRTLLSTPEGRAKHCGKQIQVFKDGVEVTGGPFVVFDGCQACEGGGKIDFSVSVLDQIDSGNACFNGVVPGISWKVLDNQVIPFVP